MVNPISTIWDSPFFKVTTEEVKSYYWWDGKVNFDPEWRVAVRTSVARMQEAETEINRRAAAFQVVEDPNGSHRIISYTLW